MAIHCNMLQSNMQYGVDLYCYIFYILYTFLYTVILEKFTSQNFQFKIIQPKNFFFESDRQKFLWVNFFNNVIISSLVKCERQPDNGSDRYAAKCKHRLGSEHTYLFKLATEFLQSSFYRSRVAAWALIQRAMRPSALTSGYFS